uniref:Uncharacterized protein n=1 Tax=Anguilla anguilla TaxID=7936 RepID=A0A0E9UFT0_ANGAN
MKWLIQQPQSYLYRIMEINYYYSHIYNF